MAGRQILNLHIGVRIPVSQPTGPVAQAAEHTPDKGEAGSSSLPRSTEWRRSVSGEHARLSTW